MTLSNGETSGDLASCSKVSLEKIDWRTLCDLEEGERIVSIGMKVYESNGGFNASQMFGGIRLKSKKENGEVSLDLCEDWRIFGSWVDREITNSDYKIIGLHGII